jgi:hypothetical protein
VHVRRRLDQNVQNRVPSRRLQRHSACRPVQLSSYTRQLRHREEFSTTAAKPAPEQCTTGVSTTIAAVWASRASTAYSARCSRASVHRRRAWATPPTGESMRVVIIRTTVCACGLCRSTRPHTAPPCHSRSLTHRIWTGLHYRRARADRDEAVDRRIRE